MAKQRLEDYFAPRKNADSQVFQFRQTAQPPDEMIDQFITRLCKLAATCEFRDISREIKSTVIQNCHLSILDSIPSEKWTLLLIT